MSTRPKTRRPSRTRAGTAHALASPASPHAAASREQFVKETKAYFAILTKPLLEMRTPKTGGREFVASYARMVDTIVGLLFQREEHVHATQLKELLAEHLRGFREAFAKA